MQTGSDDAHRDAEPLILEGNPQERRLVDAAKIGLRPGSAFQSMKSGTGLSEPCCKLVGLASFNDIASMYAPSRKTAPDQD